MRIFDRRQNLRKMDELMKRVNEVQQNEETFLRKMFDSRSIKMSYKFGVYKI
jgi:hypothetical protein